MKIPFAHIRPGEDVPVGSRLKHPTKKQRDKEVGKNDCGHVSHSPDHTGFGTLQYSG